MLFLLFPILLQAQNGVLFVDDSFIKLDKQQHVVAGMFISFATYNASLNLTKSRRKSVIIATLLSAGVGVLKEFSDKKTTGFSWGDIGATTAGGFVGAITIDILTNKKKRNQPN